MVNEATTADVAEPEVEAVSEATEPEATATPEMTVEEYKAQLASVNVEKADLFKRLQDASRALTRKEFEALGRELKPRLDKLDKAVDFIARFTLADQPVDEEIKQETLYDRYKKETTPPAHQQQPEQSQEFQVWANKISNLLKEKGIDSNNIPSEIQDDWDVAEAKWNKGQMEESFNRLNKALNKSQAATPVKKPPIPGVGVDRIAGTGSVGKTWTRTDISKMSDSDYKKNLPAIEQAMREGRIK